MSKNLLDEIFIGYLAACYTKPSLETMPITQVESLRLAFYAGATVMVDSVFSEPPISEENGEQLLKDVELFRNNVKNTELNHATAIVCLLRAVKIKRHKVLEN